MILRILNEGQYQLTGDKLAQLDMLDNQLTEAIANCNNANFQETFNEILDTVRNDGKRLPDDALAKSDLILPAPDTTLSEAQQLLTGNIIDV